MRSDETQPPNKALEVAERALSKVANVGIDGAGPFKGAIEVAEEVKRSSSNDAEVAVQQLIRVHVRFAAVNGAVTGLGGLLTLPVTLPVGLGGYYLLGARLAAGVAHLRGHDVHSEDVRTACLLVMLGSAGTEILKDAGVQIGTKGVAAALKKVPGTVFIEINKKVGFRLITKGGTKGVINAGKLVPFVGAPIGAVVDGGSMRGVAKYAKSAFPQVPAASPAI